MFIGLIVRMGSLPNCTSDTFRIERVSEDAWSINTRLGCKEYEREDGYSFGHDTCGRHKDHNARN
jgi:hypothetical protein